MLTTIDWIFIVAFFALTLFIGLLVARRAGSSTVEFFLSGRNMPWWLLGVSMVATTFSADTPNLVTDIVRKDGVSGNWVWWAFLLTGMLTVFVYAKLWRRSGIMTDLEFYELRYSGKAAAFLRGFRAIYLGVFFNVMIIASVTLAAIKIAGVLLGLSPLQTVMIGSVVTVLYTALGGLRGVVITDFFQFILAMTGMVGAAIVLLKLPEIGGLGNLLAEPAVREKTSIFPSLKDPDIYIPLLLIPLAVQWWSTWYPGAEPGGGGYIVQRVLAAKNEKHAAGATLLFNIAHYALRPWPWILIALCSIAFFPLDTTEERSRARAALATPEMTALAAEIARNAPGVTQADRELYNDLRFQRDGLTSLRQQFARTHIPDDKIGHDLAFSAMLTHLPRGLLGLVIAALIAAFMSTISTQLNWGSSYIIHDFYRRFADPKASENKLVQYGRLTTVLLMVLGAVFALMLTNALQAFQILLQIGAGTGLIFILRWFWWRINAYSEIAAMVISFSVAIYFNVFYTGSMADHWKLITGVSIATAGWLLITLLTPAEDRDTLRKFVAKIRPYPAGWKDYLPEDIPYQSSSLGFELINMLLGCVLVYCMLFGTGYLIYGQTAVAMLMFLGAAACGILLRRNWKKLNFN